MFAVDLDVDVSTSTSLVQPTYSHVAGVSGRMGLFIIVVMGL